MEHRYKHIYGPVLSRRLGRSLGVDILPYKTCSYDCVYCLLGRTTVHTIELKEYISTTVILQELKNKLAQDKPDAISFAGSGEPTLHKGLGTIVHAIKEMTDVPVVVFTNSSLLWMPEVRQNLAEVDIISPSLDAVLPASAEAINRLAPGLDCATILQGIQDFCRDYKGRIWLEVLLAANINDSPQDIKALADFIGKLEHIERVQLNTVVRPPAEKYVAALSKEQLEEIRTQLPGNVEIIASFSDLKKHDENLHSDASVEDVYDLLDRHPSTLESVAEGLSISEQLAEELLQKLLESKAILTEQRNGDLFFVVNPIEHASSPSSLA